MSRYIDADFLKTVLLKKAKQEMNIRTIPYSWAYAYQCFANSIDDFSSADVKPIVHAKWIAGPDNPFDGVCVCSNHGCDCMIWTDDADNMLYCPKCGAKMDGKENTK